MNHFNFMALFFISSVSLAKEQTKTCIYDVSGMTCASCELTLRVAVNKLDGISEIKASTGKKSATVVFNPKKITSEKIAEKINSVGYQAKLNKCQKQET